MVMSIMSAVASLAIIGMGITGLILVDANCKKIFFVFIIKY